MLIVCMFNCNIYSLVYIPTFGLADAEFSFIGKIECLGIPQFLLHGYE